mgnify:CR=1 FL=1
MSMEILAYVVIAQLALIIVLMIMKNFDDSLKHREIFGAIHDTNEKTISIIEDQFYGVKTVIREGH